MKFLLFDLLDFFLPAYCTGCSKKLTRDERLICENCLKSILPASPERINSECERKFKPTGYISDFFSPFIFETDSTIQNIIHSIKYSKKFYAGKLLGEKIAIAIKSKLDYWKIDLIIPVPLHHLKKAERGYNQSDFIAKGLSKSARIPVSNRIIKRVRFTESQTKLGLKERERNVAGAFKVRNKKAIAGKNILLVDDVITTGATINECAKVLKENGAIKIFGCSAAIAV